MSHPIDDAPELCRTTLAELTSLYASGAASPVEAVQQALARAEAVQPRFNAFTRIDADGALAAARESEARWRGGKPLSPIDGVPTTIKDFVWVTGWPTTFGSRLIPGEPAAEDAPTVARLRAAGAVFIAQTTTPELGWKAVTDSARYGITRNPWNPDHTPGGSSGGAAVAAITGAGHLHLGTDGGGSIRVPCAFTALSGIKATYGRVPAYPPSAMGTLSHIGPMTREAAATQAMLTAMSGRDLRDWTQPIAGYPADPQPPLALAGLRIGYWKEPVLGPVDPEIAAIIRTRVEALEKAGAVVEEVRLPGERHHEIMLTLWSAGAATRFASFPESELDKADPGLLSIVEHGRRLTGVDVARAHYERGVFGAAMDQLMTRYDVLVSPSVGVPPLKAGELVPEGSGMERWTEWAGFSFPINLSQQPAGSTPAGFTAAGLPVGLQVVGARGEDYKVLAVMAACEALFGRGGISRRS